VRGLSFVSPWTFFEGEQTMRRFLFALALSVAFLLPLGARADVSYSYVTDQTVYNEAPGTIFTVSLYLQETLTNNSNSIIAGDGGLASAAASITRAAGENGSAFYLPGGNYQSTTVNTAGFGTGSFRFGADSGAQTASYAQFGVTTANGVGSTSSINPVPDANGRILIGTVQITATSGTTLFNIGTYPSSGNTVTAGLGPLTADQGGFGFIDLDSTNNAAGLSDPVSYTGASAFNDSFTVVVQSAGVPEPGSMILCGLFATGMVGGYIRRRRMAAKAEAA
jgi:hypothetical protein